jgi:hypothetical protein
MCFWTCYEAKTKANASKDYEARFFFLAMKLFATIISLLIKQKLHTGMDPDPNADIEDKLLFLFRATCQLCTLSFEICVAVKKMCGMLEGANNKLLK